MRVKIVGKVHREGISKKSGRAYAFNEVHYTAPARGILGEAAKTVTMDADVFPFESIAPGIYEMEFDDTGRPVALTPLQPVPGK